VTVAHHVSSVLDCDRVVVLDHGRVVEFDTPAALETRTDGYFISMLEKEKRALRRPATIE
jgi:ABC-type multidrug transport system fused ATPase/permease subunit